MLLSLILASIERNLDSAKGSSSTGLAGTTLTATILGSSVGFGSGTSLRGRLTDLRGRGGAGGAEGRLGGGGGAMLERLLGDRVGVAEDTEEDAVPVGGSIDWRLFSFSSTCCCHRQHRDMMDQNRVEVDDRPWHFDHPQRIATQHIVGTHLDFHTCSLLPTFLGSFLCRNISCKVILRGQAIRGGLLGLLQLYSGSSGSFGFILCKRLLSNLV
ncbi:hypothetical protein ABW19_dt0208234 [Dactylella cylindrospora]|nr:hypothetical protein ABW19_dt0208234 [Dactylella cylindrospora]